MPRLVQRHDQFFQQLLDKPGTAGTLLRERLPPEVVRLLTDEPPELVPGSFVSKQLRGYRSDRLYKTRTITGRPVLIYALVEHKSRPDPRLPLQMLGYQHQILENWERTQGRNPDGSPRPLPALVTMVVYHGAEPWTVPSSLAAMTEADEMIRPYLLDFRYSLVDLGRIPDAQLSQERRLRVGLLILKHGLIGRADRKKLLKIARQALRLGYDDLATLIYYLLGDLIDDPRGDLARDILRELVPGEEERVMSLIAEQWKSEGFKQGRSQGLAEGLAEGEARGQAKMLLRLLSRRFGTLSPEIEARVREADSRQLDEWSERILDARELADIFQEDKAH